MRPGATESVPLDDSLGRTLAVPIVSNMAVPPFANSAMDGYALRSTDTAAGSQYIDSSTARVSLRVAREIQAGSLDSGAIGPGHTARIMTGAPMPEGADSVVPFEEVILDGPSISITPEIQTGACVRPAGLDIKPGDIVLDVGSMMGPRQIALAASIGAASVQVYRRPVVAILATGDELVEPGQRLRPGQIYNSNAHGLAAAVRELGAVPQMVAPGTDEPESIRAALNSISSVDLILSSGGVSVGDFDFVKQVIGEAGRVDFWRICMRPGKPLMFGEVPVGDGTNVMILGLPGNPTSTMVTFYVFARPVLLNLSGRSNPLWEPLRAITQDALDNHGGRETYFRVRLETEAGRLIATLSGGQDSSMLLPLSRATGLARVAANVERVEPGESVDVFPLP